MHERDDELALIDAAIGSALRGIGQMILFEAPAGLGKSALVSEAMRRARAVGLETLAARGRKLERSIPHGVSRRLFEPVLEKLDPSARNDVFVGTAVLARPLFGGSPLESRTEADSSPDHGLSRLLGLFWLCANLADRRPLLLTIDDAQWADPASMRFLAYLLPRLEALPVALCIAARPDAVHLVGAPFQRVRSHPAGHVRRLAPLTKEACSAIFRSKFGDDLEPERCERYWQLTQGNPFLLEQLLSTHREAGHDAAAGMVEEFGAPGDGLPLAVTRRRLAGADESERMLAGVVAVLGPASTVARCAEMAGMTDTAAKEALRSLAESGVLVDAQPIEFVHPLIADAMLELLAPGELERMYRRAARLLHSEGVSAEEVASFLLLCDPVGEPWAIDALTDAARRSTAIGAQDSSAAYLRRLLEEELPDVVRGRASIDLGRAEVLTDIESAVKHLRDSLEYFDDTAQRVEVYRMIGHVLMAVGRNREATDVFERALSEVGGSAPDLELRLKVDRVSVARQLVDKRDEALAELDFLAQEARLDDGLVARQLYTELALGHVRKGESCVDAVEALKSALGDPRANGALVGADWLLPVQFHCLAWTDQLDVGAELRAAALSEAQRRGSLMLFATVGCFGALGAFQEGLISESAALAQQAIDAIPDGWALAIPYACAIGAYAHMERGDLNEAERLLDIAFSDPRTEESLQLGFLLETRARLAMMWGTPEPAIDDCERAGRLMTEVIRTSNPAILGWRSRLARALAATGEQTTRTLDLIEEEIDLARRYGAPRPIAAALRAKGHILGGKGVECLEEATSLIQGSPALIETAASRVALGRALRLKGDVRTSRQVLNEGLREAVMCGSLMLENHARAELSAAGARPRRSAVTGVAALTPGERRVVELAAEGKANREIAEALFVTVKAVEWHLSNSYRKLGIASRSALRDLKMVNPETDPPASDS